LNKIKFKRLHDDAILPTKGTEKSGCLDLYALDSGESRISDDGIFSRVYRTGWAIELPEGYDALILPRSSIRDKSLILANGVGYIDNDYRGELLVCFKDDASQKSDVNNKGLYHTKDRMAQIRLIEQINVECEEVEELSETERGSGGWGSTGK
jgi:dUTP pyrophosphatase